MSIGKLIWQRRAQLILLTALLSLMIAFGPHSLVTNNLNSALFTASILLLLACPLLRLWDIRTVKFLGPFIEKAVFFLSALLIGQIVFYKIAPFNSLTISYFCSFVCGLVILTLLILFDSYYNHKLDSLYTSIQNEKREIGQLQKMAPTISMLADKRKIAENIDDALLWEWFFVGVSPYLIFVLW